MDQCSGAARGRADSRLFLRSVRGSLIIAVVISAMRQHLLGFPEVHSILSQQGRSEDGTDHEGVNMKTFVHLKPRF